MGPDDPPRIAGFEMSSPTPVAPRRAWAGRVRENEGANPGGRGLGGSSELVSG